MGPNSVCSRYYWPESFSTRTQDRKSTRLNSSHSQISYAVFCLKKKKSKQASIISILFCHLSNNSSAQQTPYFIRPTVGIPQRSPLPIVSSRREISRNLLTTVH